MNITHRSRQALDRRVGHLLQLSHFGAQHLHSRLQTTLQSQQLIRRPRKGLRLLAAQIREMREERRGIVSLGGSLGCVLGAAILGHAAPGLRLLLAGKWHAGGRWEDRQDKSQLLH